MTYLIFLFFSYFIKCIVSYFFNFLQFYNFNIQVNCSCIFSLIPYKIRNKNINSFGRFSADRIFFLNKKNLTTLVRLQIQIWYQPRDLNPHTITSSRFWVYRVYHSARLALLLNYIIILVVCKYFLLLFLITYE